MTKFGWLRHIPRSLLFAIAGLVQVGLLTAMVIDRIIILRTGTEVTLQTAPVDPRDLLRGDYVALRYAISTVNAGDLAGAPVRRTQPSVYVKLTPNDQGIYTATSTHLQPVSTTGAEILIKGRVTGGANCGPSGGNTYCGAITVNYGLEKFFVPQGEGLVIEQAQRQRGSERVAIVAAITPSGRAAIKRLLIDGKTVYAEPPY